MSDAEWGFRSPPSGRSARSSIVFDRFWSMAASPPQNGQQPDYAEKAVCFWCRVVGKFNDRNTRRDWSYLAHDWLFHWGYQANKYKKWGEPIPTLFLFPFHSHHKKHERPPCHLSLTRWMKKKFELCPGAKFEAICFNQGELLSRIAAKKCHEAPPLVLRVMCLNTPLFTF